MISKNKSIELVTFLLLTFILFVSGNLFWSSFGIGLFAMFAVRFFNNLGKNIDIRDIIIVFSSLQWVFGPYLAYRYYTNELGYQMVIPENNYMGFVVPTICFFSFGLFVPLNLKKATLKHTLKSISFIVSRTKNIDLFFIFIGIFMSFLWKSMPESLRFISFLLGNFHFVGILFLLKNKARKNRTLYLVLAFLFTFVSSLNSGMFHNLILWLGFMLLFVAYIKNFSVFKKLSLIVLIFSSVIIIQTVKAQFRSVVWSEDLNTSGEKIETFYLLVSENVDGNFLMSQANINNLVSRINQGWIISSIMYHVPVYEPYANGETILAGITATLIPRFLYENKASAGGVKNFERFTGHKLQPGTSMNLSILGEAYANFGPSRSLFFMFFFGLFLNYSYAVITRLIIKRPTLLFFIPIIYLQVVKAETDFVTVLNHLIKASIFIALVYWGLKQFFRINL